MVTFNTANAAWVNVLGDLVAEGNDVSPRDMDTMELLHYSSTLDMSYPIVTIPERKLGYRFMMAEASWIMNGDNKVRTIEPYSKKIVKFSDDRKFFFGAYGPQVVDQLMYVVDALVEDHLTRQAVMTIWRKNPRKSKDIPCTISVQWIIRDHKLHCIDTMRSSDVWLGWPYDVFNFSMLSMYVLLLLRARGYWYNLGTLTLTAGSQHIYGAQVDDAINIVETWHDREAYEMNAFKPECFPSPEAFITYIGMRADVNKPIERIFELGKT